MGKGVLSGDVRGRDGRAFGKRGPLELGGSLGGAFVGDQPERLAGPAHGGLGSPESC